ncbi:208L [Invertebrate iridescent virus 6]|uniref:208L n=1 Tax=Invertebrate iridescent virus 6 TaxID=176652 RepID=Q91FW2_IIV6|nr:208L [Invertebrate iridescent virus 6]AAK82070.1 208L [Invertebrate iridescent virus 6]QMS79578.1 hypothetical protein IIV6-T1_207 [Invertebrate iridescent virus 6]
MDVDFSEPFLIAMMLGNKDHMYSNNLGIVSILLYAELALRESILILLLRKFLD